MTKQEHNKNYYSKNREALLLYQRAYNKKNKSAISIRRKESYQQNRDRLLAEKKEYGIRNKGKILAKNLAYYNANRNQLVEYARRYRAENKEKVRLRNRKYYAKYPEKAKHWREIYFTRNPHKAGEYEARRRLLEKNAAINQMGLKEFYNAIRSRESVYCYYCNAKIKGKSAHFDHIIPLSKGGQHSADNLCISCKSCNCSKGDKALSEWAKHSQQFLSL